MRKILGLCAAVAISALAGAVLAADKPAAPAAGAAPATAAKPAAKKGGGSFEDMDDDIPF